MIDVSKKQETNTLKLIYQALDIVAHLDWRMPTTTEARAFRTDSARAMLGKAEDKTFDHGLALLTGIRDNEWGFEGKPFSSNSESPDYRADWKDLLSKNPVARKIISDLAVVVYDGSIAYKEGDEEKAPFGQSSGG